MDRSPRQLWLVLLLPAAALAAARLWTVDEEATTDVPSTTVTAPSTSHVATGLHPGLERAVAAAVSAAAAEGHTLTVTSGFRTADEQARLLAEAVDEYGSMERALRWVFSPERSMHVQGLAVDMGDGPAADWLDEHGAAFGLCRTLAWEWWHFEWRPEWEASRTCPDPVDDPPSPGAASPTRG